MKNAYNIEDITSTIKENEKVLLFVADHSCTTAQALDEKIEEFVATHQEIAGIRTNLKAVPTLPSEYMILTAPTIVVFKKGKEVFREGRFLQFEELEAVVE